MTEHLNVQQEGALSATPVEAPAISLLGRFAMAASSVSAGEKVGHGSGAVGALRAAEKAASW